MRRFALVLVIAGSCATVPYAAQSAASPKARASKARPALAFADSFVYPHVWLKNDSLEAKVYIPNSRTGFYRSTRFNWSGMVGELRYRGHSYFQHWKRQPHDATNIEHGIGIADEFDLEPPASPPGFIDAKPGEKFLKIGVGALVKTADTSAYKFNIQYAIADTGTWTVTLEENAVVMEQELSTRTYGYWYKKRIALQGTSLVTSHQLRNTGTSSFSTVNYAHNLFIIDGDTTGTPYRIVFATKPTPKDWQITHARDFGASLDSNVLTYTRGLQADKSNPFSFPALTEGMQSKLAVITNLRTGAVAALSTDVLPSEFRYWSALPVCPEPFIQLDLKPGESRSWTMTIALSQVSPAAPRKK